MEFMLVGLGGAFGSLARYSLGRFVSEKIKMTFPLGTFIINVTGAVLLGIVNGLGVGNNAYLLLAEGFLGAYTTFSTFMYEGFSLYTGKKKLNAIIYIFTSLLLGISGYAAGFKIVALR